MAGIENPAPEGTEPLRAEYLIIGGGLAAASAAETLRAEGATGSVMMLCAENLPPYHRPSLSKAPTMREAVAPQILVHPEQFYREHAIELRLGTTVRAVDPERRIVTTKAGEEIGYRRLLIATGSTPRPLKARGAELRGVHTLRTVADAEAIRQTAAGAKHAVVLGGSFLGLEIAMALRELGLEVTIIERGPELLYRLEAPGLSKRFQQHVESRGLKLLFDTTTAALHGRDAVRELETVTGIRMPCELVVVSIGVTPTTEFLAGSGIALENGYIVADDQLRTNVPDIFAAGDVTAFYDPVFAQRRHIEHWDNAVKQGRLAARNMMGRRLRYDEVSYFFCEIGDVGFNVLGVTEGADEWIGRGDPDPAERSFALFYLKDDVPRALFSIGRPADETRIAEDMIRYRINLQGVKDRLPDSDFDLEHLPLQTALILQGGGALGAFECGVVKALEEQQIFPDIVAGVSIGAFNGAIIASHPHGATEALEAFWEELAVAAPPLPAAWASQTAVAMRILALGVPNFFRPRWMPSFQNMLDLPVNWKSFYDTAPMRALLMKYVDFPRLKSSPVRLLVSAINVATAELEIFDSYVDDLTPDHILASGSLPPGFPWTVIDGKAYWDGGIISNSPLDLVNERCGPDGKRVFIVDLFSNERELPSNIMEVMARRDEIIYSERVRSDLRHRETSAAYRRLTDFVLSHLEPAEASRIRHLPSYIQLMGRGAPTSITRFVREARSGEHPSRDYDFSDIAIRAEQEEGYMVASKELTEN
ncbi:MULTISPECIES: FAD-dependent oxidoreductase [Actibacterium]|jgi:NTE family protein|uniref:NTE family protein n=1 Tax=Actibacterium naphthalenivorans TaxID=1614693 RepID=A0A840CF62_9RHOB|nr:MULTISPECIES: FAD-dependent oxidoreductase [Actibacterium]MBB4022752.1 NTE family protein [Actibacterium naphthalenivorans]